MWELQGTVVKSEFNSRMQHDRKEVTLRSLRSLCTASPFMTMVVSYVENEVRSVVVVNLTLNNKLQLLNFKYLHRLSCKINFKSLAKILS